MTSDAPPTVLVVDPDAEVADRLRDGLAAVGDFEVLHAETAAEARAAEGVDAVVSEYALPDASGVDLLADLRETTPDLPFVLLTDHGSEAVASDAFARDATDYVPKGDGDADRVAATLREELSRREAAGPVEGAGDRQCVVGIAEDVTARRQADRERREMLDRMTDGFFALDADWRLVYHNARAADTFDRLGVDLADGVGESFWDLIPGVRGTVFEEQFRRAMTTGEAVTFEAYFDPTEMWVESRVFPSETGISVYFRDVTERHEREAEIRRQNERLDQFAAIVSHDLRNPLAVAKGHLGFARDRYDDTDLETVADALDRIQTIVQDVLSLAREGRIVQNRDPVSLAAVARDAWATVAPENADLVVAGDVEFSADRSRLRQVFENLFHNAVAHTAGGPREEPAEGEPPGVTVRVGPITGTGETAETTVELGADAVIGFYVEDDGPGIPEADRDLVFRPGYTTADQGTGFGLPIVEQIVLAHGWEVRVAESEEGGARFEVTGVTPLG